MVTMTKQFFSPFALAALIAVTYSTEYILEDDISIIIEDSDSKPMQFISCIDDEYAKNTVISSSSINVEGEINQRLSGLHEKIVAD
jgi:hypothetical protein